MQQQRDIELWSRVQAGQGEALGLLFDKHHRRVYQRALGLLGNVQDAQDATAVVFFELCRKQSGVIPIDGSIAPWLLATTTNVCRNVSRASRRYRSLLHSLPSRPSEPSAESTALSNVALTDGLDPALVRALDRLPAKTQALLLLTAVDGYSISDAAKVVDMSPGAAKTRLSRARALMRDAPIDVASQPQKEEGVS